MKKSKKQSKRQTLRTKYKINKKVREHHRKVRKESKGKERARNAMSPLAKLSKDPGIPNLHPLKEQLLEKAARKRERMKEEAERQKERRKQELANQRKQRMRSNQSFGSDELEFMRHQADENQRDFEEKNALSEAASAAKSASSSVTSVTNTANFFREFRKLTESSDVILCVLDARDPLACRSPDIERAIMSKDPNKRIIYVVNKIDLVPKEAVVAWLAYLRHLYPTVAFKSATHDQRSHYGQASVSAVNASVKQLRSKESIGASALLQLLKNYARSQNNQKKIITVGVIGFPNVGKSSLINSLKRSRAVGVGSTPGFTKKTQEIYLDKNIRLLDCPGVVFPSSHQSEVSLGTLALQNVLKIEQLDDPVEPVKLILDRVKKSNLLATYSIADFSNVNEFLMLIAAKRGKLLAGGVANIEAAARLVLKDWISGRITYVALPPSTMPAHVISAEVVTAWSKEFSVDSVAQQAQDELETDVTLTDDVLVPSTSISTQISSKYYSGEGNDEIDEEEEEDDGDDEDEGMTTSKSTKQRRAPPTEIRSSVAEAFLSSHGSSSSSSTSAKKKKSKSKQQQSGGAAADSDEPYDFLTDFIADNEMTADQIESGMEKEEEYIDYEDSDEELVDFEEDEDDLDEEEDDVVID